MFVVEPTLRLVCVRVFARKRRGPLIPPFDIFKVETNSVIWKGTAESFEVAELSVKVLMVSSPGKYIIHSQKTGHRTLVKADGSTEPVD